MVLRLAARLGCLTLLVALSACGGSDEPAPAGPGTEVLSLNDDPYGPEVMRASGSDLGDSCLIRPELRPVTARLRDSDTHEVLGEAEFDNLGRWIPSLDHCVTTATIEVSRKEGLYDITLTTGSGLTHESELYDIGTYGSFTAGDLLGP
jgi:hypothetical protein